MLLFAQKKSVLTLFLHISNVDSICLQKKSYICAFKLMTNLTK